MRIILLLRRLRRSLAFGLLSLPLSLAAAPDCRESGELSVHCGQTPSAIFDDQGNLWVAFAHENHAYVSHSADAGRSYSDPVRVNEVAEAIEVNGENRPKILLDGEHVYVSWTQETEGMFTGDIRFSRSADGGVTFSEPRTINDDGLLTSHRFDSLFLSEAGQLYITWLDKRELEYAAEVGEDYRGSAVFYAVSTDQGASFSENHKVADHSCECCRIAVAPHGEEGMALMWRHIYDETTRDHAIATVDPHGNVSYEARASHDEWHIQACPHHGPAMAVDPMATDGAAYHLAWFANGERLQGIHYGRHALNQGETRRIHQVDGNAGASHPQVTAFDGELFLIWKRFDGHETVLFLIRSMDNGTSWTEPEVLASTAGGSDHPALLMADHGLFFAWHTSEEGYRIQQLAHQGFNPEPFTAESFDAIKAEYEGTPFLLALWSVTCPPCMIELEMLGELRKEVPDLPLVLVSTDFIGRADRAEDFLLRYDLADMRSWMFADDHAARLRFSIDPNWFGELPRSYYFDADHDFEAHSGVLTEEQARSWLDL